LCKSCDAGVISITLRVTEIRSGPVLLSSFTMEDNRSRPVLRVLIADDDPASVRLVKEGFTSVGTPHTFNVVRDGDEALDFVHKRGRYADAPTPDVVLLDLNMPRRSGFDVLCEVKAHPELRQIIVIVFSTSTENRDVTKAYDCAANCYISKPSDLSGYFRLAGGIDEFWGRRATLPFHSAA
jgi:two-component system, chemotaxis family, response regulator Rcp1